MAQGDLLDPLKLGPPGSEMDLSTVNDAQAVSPFTETPGRSAARAQNVIAERFVNVFSQYTPRFRIMLDAASKKTRDAIRSIYAIADTHLSFVYAVDWAIYSERYPLITSTTFTMRTNPYQRLDKAYDDLSLAATLKAFAVFTTRDMRGAQGGTNFFTGGSYNRQTRLVTLGSSPGAAGTIVYANYTYTGCLVEMTAPPKLRTIANFDGTGQNLYVIPLSLGWV